MTLDWSTIRWLFASVAVPIVIGVGSAIATHWLSLRKTRLDLRMTERRKSYNELLPALADVLAHDQRQLRCVYREFGSQQAEDAARATDEEWNLRHSAAMTVIRAVIAKRELAASTGVLKALDSMMDRYSKVDPSTHCWDDACEAFLEATLAAVDEVRKEVAREV
ncbi:MAG: hypothetical protein U1E29_08235 [Coriobacteriia bacterium]|nr:hypothetical protein [Coriobacteriia bacterium]